MTKNGSRRPPLVADRRYTGQPAKKSASKKTSARGKASGGGGRRGGGKPPRRGSPRKPRRNLPLILALPLALLRWVLRMFLRLVLAAALVTAVLVAIGVFYDSSTMAPFNSLTDARAKGSVTLLDRYGKVFAWRGQQFGGVITAEGVSPALRNAVVATEDKRFYHHFGVSPRGIASAIKINLAAGRGPLSGNGGSTLTQQVAKLLCIGQPYDPSSGLSEAQYEAQCRESSLWRKVKEAVYAMALEVKFTKDQILTIYLNRAYLGSGAYGFEAASERYFGKHASALRPAEAAMLAGALTAPSYYDPASHYQRSWDRALTVLRLMQEQGYLTKEQAAYESSHPPVLNQAATETREGGYFADWVMSSGPDFLTRSTTEDVVIRTTYDPKIQAAAEEALGWIFDNKVDKKSEAQAAIIVMSADGAVRAMVGGRDRGVPGGFNRATQAMRQTGSAFKPFVYAAALDLGWRYDSIIEDAPITIDIPGSGPWTPSNYDNKFHGWVTLTDALRNSYNIPAVKLSEAVGRDNVRTVAQMFGIESDLAAGPALALGASDTTLLQMTGAYAGILNGGSSVTPYGLVELRLRGDSSPLMEQAGGIGERVITPKADRQLIYMMNQVVDRGSGHRARLDGREAAGKTGTTTAAKDAWFVGFTADYVAGVWMGYDKPKPLRGVTGGGLPAEIWHETMKRVEKGLPATPLPMIRPDAPPTVENGQPGPGTTAPAGVTTRTPKGEDTLLGVLRSILGIKQ